MSEQVEVRFGDNVQDQAVLLLAAAEELNLPPQTVQTREGSFYVPQEVYDKAFGSEAKDEEPEQKDEPEQKAPAKKAARRSTTRKKG